MKNHNQSLLPLVRRMGLFVLLTIQSMAYAQVDTAYTFIVAGHAYGSHSGENIGLHPALLDRLNSGYDSKVAFFVFTGDIVNRSTTESWQQVEDEMAGYALSYYFVMGNHDDNEIGRQVFEDKYGGTYYTFKAQNDLFIVLNSIESGRSVSLNQIEFLEEQITRSGDTIHNIFIFFHEVLWNSHEKYTGVKSNSRSRYDQIVNYSNYWDEVHPILLRNPLKNFYLISGDVGGNPDAIAAFYDSWDHITFLSSGMGEVADENYLLVQVSGEDSIEFELVPLQSDINLLNIVYYSVPGVTEAIIGPEAVPRGSSAVEYSVPGVFNASSYIWELPDGATGFSTSTQIAIDFNNEFAGGYLTVRAAREGFGEGPATSMLIQTDFTPVELTEADEGSIQVNIFESNDYLTFGLKRIEGEVFTIRIFDSSGRFLISEKSESAGEYAELQILKNDFKAGIHFITVSTQSRHITRKFVIR